MRKAGEEERGGEREETESKEGQTYDDEGGKRGAERESLKVRKEGGNKGRTAKR